MTKQAFAVQYLLSMYNIKLESEDKNMKKNPAFKKLRVQ